MTKLNFLILLATATAGLSGMVIQIIIIRQLLVVFQGNELTIGIILANWLLLEAFGALIARSLGRGPAILGWFKLVLFLSAFAMPLSLYLGGGIRTFLAIPPGRVLTLTQIFLSSFWILTPLCLTHGALFTLACRSMATIHDSSRIYIVETGGTMLGALLFTFLLAPHWHSYFIVVALVGLLLAPLVFLALTSPTAPFLRMGLLLLLGVIVLFHPVLSQNLQDVIILHKWPHQQVIEHVDSLYGNITVTAQREQRIVYYDGTASVIVPTPDLELVENLAHFPLLFHREPRRVLLISGGIGGLLQEIQRHPVERITYVDLDPLLIERAQALGIPLIQQELSDERLVVEHVDGRRYLVNTKETYDVIILGLREPATFQINRLFTKESFRYIQSLLAADGVFALALPGSAIYLDRALLDLNRCIYQTLSTVFPHIRILPEHLNLYLATNSSLNIAVEPQDLVYRLRQRGVKPLLLTEHYLDYRLNQTRWQSFTTAIQAEMPILINSDLTPSAVFYTLSFWGAMVNPWLHGFFRIAEQIPGWALNPWAMVGLLFFCLILARGVGKHRGIPVGYTVFTTGLAGMGLDLIILLTFQSIHGYVYQQMGLIIALYMGGAAVGSWLGRQFLRDRWNYHGLILIEAILVLFLLLLPIYFHHWSSHTALIFYLFSLVAGIITGSQFPMASICLAQVGVRSPGGLVYGLDLLGGWLGGLLTTVLLIPLLGMANTSLAMAFVKLTALIMLVAFYRSQQYGKGEVYDS